MKAFSAWLKDWWYILAVFGVGFGLSALMYATRPPPKQYPAPLVCWAKNTHNGILGAQCETAADTMVCDVNTGDAMHKVKCDNKTCWLEFTQDKRQ